MCENHVKFTFHCSEAMLHWSKPHHTQLWLWKLALDRGTVCSCKVEDLLSGPLQDSLLPQFQGKGLMAADLELAQSTLKAGGAIGQRG